MVRAFLSRRIEEARDAATGRGVADWREDLESALDYRGWLRVELLYRAGSQGRWRPFDAGRHGSKSGGEKVVLLSQPLFAAAVVAYDAAGPLAPRMVWLDEAMTGVDDGVKAAFMGLLVQFDLDVMLTAHDEWCRYPTVPAAAVYDLARQRHVAGVDALPFLWCSGAFEEVTMAPPGRNVAAQRIASDDGLFADLDGTATGREQSRCLSPMFLSPMLRGRTGRCPTDSARGLGCLDQPPSWLLCGSGRSGGSAPRLVG